MDILILNCILHTPEKGTITRRPSNRDCMIYNLARGFAELGHRVTLVASEEYRPLQEESNPFDIVWLPSRWKRVFRPDLFPLPAGLGKWLKRNAGRFDMVLSSEIFMMPTLLAARIAPGKLLIWQELSDYQRMFRKIPAKVWYKAIAPLFMKGCRVVARSPRARAFAARHLPRVLPDVVDHGCNGDVFFPGDVRDDAFIVISQLIPRKRIDRILASFASFVKDPEFSRYKLHIVGDGPEENALKRLSSELGLQENTVWHGRMAQADFAPIGRRCVAMLVDTEMDLNMVSIPEAIANGTPVLSNTVPNTAEFINAEKVGMAKEGWDHEDLKEMVRRYGEHHANCRRVRERLTHTGCARALLACIINTPCVAKSASGCASGAAQ